MSHCSNCGTAFRFIDLAKGLNPAKVQCSGCKKFVESSNVIAILVLVIIALLALAAYWLPFTIGGFAPSRLIRIIGVFILGGIAEYLYYLAIAKGIIKSNLVIEK